VDSRARLGKGFLSIGRAKAARLGTGECCRACGCEDCCTDPPNELGPAGEFTRQIAPPALLLLLR